MIIEIDSQSGFCFGVKRAIHLAEKMVSEEELISLGEIVHNHEEIDRLSQLGIKTIEREEISALRSKNVLIRTHGEPPTTYSLLEANKNKIIDATCPVVLKLQERIRNSYSSLSKINGQLVLLGKKNHPEVLGLVGQTKGEAIVVSTVEDLEKIDFARPVELFSQTTIPIGQFQLLCDEIRSRAKNEVKIHDTICRQVSNRAPHLAEFSRKFDVLIFVSGRNSSNGKFLYSVCKENNPSSYFISSPEEIRKEWFESAKKTGICGATSTPLWLMEKVQEHVTTILNIQP